MQLAIRKAKINIHLHSGVIVGATILQSVIKFCSRFAVLNLSLFLFSSHIKDLKKVITVPWSFLSNRRNVDNQI